MGLGKVPCWVQNVSSEQISDVIATYLRQSCKQCFLVKWTQSKSQVCKRQSWWLGLVTRTRVALKSHYTLTSDSTRTRPQKTSDLTRTWGWRLANDHYFHVIIYILIIYYLSFVFSVCIWEVISGCDWGWQLTPTSRMRRVCTRAFRAEPVYYCILY